MVYIVARTRANFNAALGIRIGSRRPPEAETVRLVVEAQMGCAIGLEGPLHLQN